MRGARLVALGLGLALAGLAGGCVVLPVPQRVVHYPPLVGRLMVRATGQPAPGVLISIGEPGACPCARTDAEGAFVLIGEGTRFPYTSGVGFGDAVAQIAIIWATVDGADGPRRRRIGQILIYPPTWSDPGTRNQIPAELGILWL